MISYKNEHFYKAKIKNNSFIKISKQLLCKSKQVSQEKFNVTAVSLRHNTNLAWKQFCRFINK